MNLEEMQGGGGWEEGRVGKSIRIHCLREESIFNKKKKKRKCLYLAGEWDEGGIRFFF